MKVVSILLIIALILFTIWQIYLTIRKIQEKKKNRSVVTQNDSIKNNIENNNKGENE